MRLLGFPPRLRSTLGSKQCGIGFKVRAVAGVAALASGSLTTTSKRTYVAMSVATTTTTMLTTTTTQILKQQSRTRPSSLLVPPLVVVSSEVAVGSADAGAASAIRRPSLSTPLSPLNPQLESVLHKLAASAVTPTSPIMPIPSVHLNSGQQPLTPSALLPLLTHNSSNSADVVTPKGVAPAIPSINSSQLIQSRRMSSTALATTSIGLRHAAKKLGRAAVLQWDHTPKKVMVVTKLRDPDLVTATRDFASWLVDMGMDVYVEDVLKLELDNSPSKDADDSDSAIASESSNSPLSTRVSSPPLEPFFAKDATSDIPAGRLLTWNKAEILGAARTRAPPFDLAITLGGDGTVLYTASLFSGRLCPPLVPFDLGSLGFLTMFDFDSARETLSAMLNPTLDTPKFVINMRMRLACTVWRVVPDTELPDLAAAASTSLHKKDVQNVDGVWMRRDVSYHVLNELVVDRGPSPYMSQMELYVDDAHLTTMQADGLVVATPTGSTAYSLSANGSVVHPSVPALLVTPICPHTLSFRPMLLPDSVEFRVQVPIKGARTSTAWASFDGRNRVELKAGDFVCVTMSRFPVPTVCADDQSKDWIESLRRCLHFNVRKKQKEFR